MIPNIRMSNGPERSKDLPRLIKAQERLENLLESWAEIGYTEKTFESPPNNFLKLARGGFLVQLLNILKLLHVKGHSGLRMDYPELFDIVFQLEEVTKDVCKYELLGTNLDWHSLWLQFDSQLENDLLHKLNQAIAKEVKRVLPEKEEGMN